MKILKYGPGYPALSDYEVVSKLDSFCKDLDLIETSNFLVFEGVRAMICKGDLNHEEVEFHLDEVDEIRKCDKDGQMEDFPRVYGSELFDSFLDILLKLDKY